MLLSRLKKRYEHSQCCSRSALFISYTIAMAYLVVSQVLKPLLGTYYDNYDPSYPYLFNSLNLVSGYPVDHIDHPGVALHVFCAALLRPIHFFAPNGTLPIFQSVIESPEYYIHFLNVAIAVFVSLASVALFVSACRAGLSKWMAIFVQVVPLFFFQTWLALYDMKPEPFLLGGIFLVGALVLDEFSADALDKRPTLLRPIALGMLIGLLVMLKVNALPLVLLCFYPKKVWRKFLCVFATLISTGGFFLLLLPRLPKVQYWFTKLTVNQGRYGSGEAGFPSVFQLFENLWILLKGAPIFWFCFVLAWLVVFWFITRQRRGRIAIPSPIFRSGVNLAIFLFMTVFIQLGMVLKHPGVHYLLPTMALLPVVVALVLRWLKEVDLIDKYKRVARWVLLGATVCALGLIFHGSWSRHRVRLQRETDIAAATGFVRQMRPSPILARSTKLSGQDGAIRFGLQWAGVAQFGYYHSDFAKYQNRFGLFCDSGTFWVINGPIDPNAILQEVQRSKRPLVLLRIPKDHETGKAEITEGWMRAKPIKIWEHAGLYQVTGVVSQ